MDGLIVEVYRSLMSQYLPYSSLNRQIPGIARVIDHISMYNFFSVNTPLSEFMRRYYNG